MATATETLVKVQDQILETLASIQKPIVTGFASALRSPGNPKRMMYSPSHSMRCVASTVLTSNRRIFIVRRLYSTSSGFFGSGSAPMALAAMRSAAVMYFSMSTGEMVNTSAMLSNPSPESSTGNS